MKQFLIVASFLCLLSPFACQKTGSHTRNGLLGQYELTARDKSEQVVFTGTITLVSQNQNHLKGQCSVVKKEGAPSGLFDQDGDCEALVEGNEVHFDFAPLMDDAGLLLQGQIENGRITGVWMIDGFATSPPLGRFEAVKR